MKKNPIVKNLFFGLLSWLIPFAASFLFFKPGGELVVPYATFKSTIMVVGTITGCFLLLRYFKFVERNFVTNGIIVGVSWFAINVVLDALILIPMMNTTFADYFMSIGLSYFSIPAISITFGFLLDKKQLQVNLEGGINHAEHSINYK